MSISDVENLPPSLEWDNISLYHVLLFYSYYFRCAAILWILVIRSEIYHSDLSKSTLFAVTAVQRCVCNVRLEVVWCWTSFIIPRWAVMQMWYLWINVNVAKQKELIKSIWNVMPDQTFKSDCISILLNTRSIFDCYMSSNQLFRAYIGFNEASISNSAA